MEFDQPSKVVRDDQNMLQDYHFLSLSFKRGTGVTNDKGAKWELTTGCFFLTGSALKVLSVGVGKIPTKKVKVLVKASYLFCEIPLLSFFGRDLAISNT